MAITDKLVDGVVGKVTKKKIETIRVEPEQLALMTKEYFVDAIILEEFPKFKKVIKGGLFTNKQWKSKDNRYELCVLAANRGILLGTGRAVWIKDYEKEVFYQLSKDRKYKKWYKLMDSYLIDRRRSL